ncbi:NAD(P)-dependent oxidoreductase [Bacteroides acidifaciens]|uniref:NAD(P)-dependent oxidoreductase n=1 Tax=Bacteroides acidifaciens TaxID=85831 RepID=UPI00263AF8B1|nr:NAD(P)-dependent oxidoreductase [Bacteroides acidifaciens]
MNKTALIGASGFVGGAILDELLSRGYKVEALVRNPSKIAVENPDLTVKKVDVADEKALTEDLKGYDTVISAYNPGWTNPNIYNETLQNYPGIVEAAKKAGVKRLLIVGGAGTLFCAPGLRVVDSGVIPAEIMDGVKSLGKFYLDILINEKDIDWVFFSPAGAFVEGTRTGKYRLGKDDLIVDSKGNSTISVADYAKAMVDELETPAHHKERFTIGY